MPVTQCPMIVKLTTTDGIPIEFVNVVKGQGGMKDVYFSPDRTYVVAFFRDRQDVLARERLQEITSRYRVNVFEKDGGEYWKQFYCWPTHVVEWNGRLGVVAPFYSKEFFFDHGSKNNDMLGIKGREKEGKWFASASNQNRFLDPRERGDWRNYIRICILISRAVKRLHAAGLAHSDLSYKNVLVDPVSGLAAIIDIDGLVVPGKFPPDVIGTPDFIAPEVVMTQKLQRGEPSKKLPSITTDRHALAVLIYMYLLYRHPLDGDKIHDVTDELNDHALRMGSRALFVEHPTDTSNRIKVKNRKPSELPWADTSSIPYSVTGPYLVPLFNKAFIDGLHDPSKRPTADDWESALVKTIDLIQPCQNATCGQKWYVFDNSSKPRCPFCGTHHKGRLPVLNLYSSRRAGNFMPDNHRLMVYSNQSLFMWHVNRLVTPNERLANHNKKRVGYFVEHKGVWYLVNENMSDLKDVDKQISYPIGSKIELVDGLKILLSREDGGRLVHVQMAEGT